MSEISILNGYKIKDKKAIRYYDTVSDMVSDTTLKAGMHVKTSGYYAIKDGGNAEYKIRIQENNDVIDSKFIISLDNTLIAELITDDLVNICQVGGQTDFSDVCNYVLSLNKSIYVPRKVFNADDSIHITNDNSQFICDGEINFTVENSTLFYIENQRAVMKFNNKITAPTNSTIFEIGSDEREVRYLNLYVHYISDCGTGMIFNPNNGHGVTASQINFDRINASNIGILLQPKDTGANYVNSIVFNCGQIASLNPVVTRKGNAQTDRFNHIVFNELIVSDRNGLNIALDLQFMQKSYFNQIRMSEGHTGEYWVQLDNCSFVNIDTFSYFDIAKLNVINSQGISYPNFFKAAYIRDAQDHWVSTEAFELNGKIILKPGTILNSQLVSLETENESSTEFILPAFYHNDMSVKIGTSQDNEELIYQLPDIFERRGVTEFYVYVTEKPSNTRLALNIGNTVVAQFKRGTSINNKLYHVKIFGKAFTNVPTTKVEEVNLML